MYFLPRAELSSNACLSSFFATDTCFLYKIVLKITYTNHGKKVLQFAILKDLKILA
jgi:hypothetical protein